MKSIVAIVACVVVCVTSELHRQRPARFRLQRQELAPTTTDSPTEPTTELQPPAPYPAAGWQPAVPFTLPAKPDDSYGAPAQNNAPYPPAGWKPDGPALTLPQQQYGTPDNTYGPPDNTYGAPNTEAAEDVTTENPQAEKLDGPVQVQKTEGEYYVLLPNGLLQKVQFVTENEPKNMKYTAQLRLQKPQPVFFARA